jgi:Fe-S oxidoreductase
MINEMEDLLEHLASAEVAALPENGVCCGFGGSTSVTAPEVSAGILARKLECADVTNAPTLVSDNPGCILHMRGGVDASGRSLRVVHVAEFLASLLPPEAGSDRLP